MSSSYIPSVNHSTESIINNNHPHHNTNNPNTSSSSINNSINSSSLQRSGLNMSVGDTKSIVLALQALQDKIRRLEQDRNHHQDQYERALQAHDLYKQDMEKQLEHERNNHRQREKELQELVQRATAEKTKLQHTLEESRKDLGTFRTELEEMLVKECDAAQKRENALASEVDKLRKEIEEQQKKHQSLILSIEELRAEKEAALDTNHHLEEAIQELMRMYKGQGRDREFHSNNSNNNNSNNNNNNRRKVQRGRQTNNNTHNNSNINVDSSFIRPSSTHRRMSELRQRSETRPSPMIRSNSARNISTYRDPTYSSIQRDVRKEGSGTVPENNINNYNHHNHSHNMNGSVLIPGTSHNTRSKTNNINNSNHNNHNNNMNTSSIERTRQYDAMAEVCHELEEELNTLRRDYKVMIEKSDNNNNNNNNNNEEDDMNAISTETLQHLAGRMQRKAEQIRLIKEAQKDLRAAGIISNSNLNLNKVPQRRPPVGSDKITQRNLIVNELRSLFAQQRQ